MKEAKLKVELIAHTPDPERTIATAAHMCYAGVTVDELKTKLSDEQVAKLLKMLITSGHHSTLEHASFTFAIEGVSRALTHQLVRHRIASYSQQSQRYVNEENMAFIVPPKVRANKEQLKAFEEAMEQTREAYKKMIDAGIPKEDARFILPNAVETRIVVTMNTRALFNFLDHRLCTRAQWEIRVMAHMMLKELKKVAPGLFNERGPICYSLGYCPEPKTCGLYPLKKDVIPEKKEK